MGERVVEVAAAATAGAASAVAAWIVLLPWNLPPSAANGGYGTAPIIGVLVVVTLISVVIAWISGSTPIACTYAAAGAATWTAVMVWRLVAIDGIEAVNLLGVTIVFVNIPLSAACIATAYAIARRAPR